MTNLIIFGGKGNGTVLLEAVLDINKMPYAQHYNIIGFVNNQYANIKEIEGYPVLGDIANLESLIEKHNAYFINGISSVKTMELVKYLFDDKFSKLCDRLISIIHPNSFIGRNVKIGDGSFIGPQNYIGQNTSIGKHCFIHSQCYIARDAQLSDYNYLAPKVYIGAEVRTRESVYFGVGSLVKEHINIANNSVIGMGSIIVDNVEKESKYFGEKAKKRN
jgi:acetyltransferase EpsM